MFKNIKELQKACYDKTLDISGIFNSNTIEYNSQTKKYEVFLSIDGIVETFDDKNIKSFAKEYGLI